MKDGVIKLSSNSFSDLLLTKHSESLVLLGQNQPRPHGLLSLSELNAEREALGTRLHESNIL